MLFVSVNVVLFCVLMYFFIFFSSHFIYAFYVLYTVFCLYDEINYIIHTRLTGYNSNSFDVVKTIRQ